MPRPPKQSVTVNIQPQEQRIPFNRMGQIRQANRLLNQMGSPTRIGNVMNPALRQSVWDTSNLQSHDEDQ